MDQSNGKDHVNKDENKDPNTTHKILQILCKEISKHKRGQNPEDGLSVTKKGEYRKYKVKSIIWKVSSKGIQNVNKDINKIME